MDRGRKQFWLRTSLEWIDSKKTHIAAAGWSTLASLVAIKPDNELNIGSLKKLLARIEKDINKVDDRVRSKMNTFIIALGSHVKSLTDDAIKSSRKIGELTIDTNGTACKVSNAADCIKKIKDKGNLGKKKKMAKC